MYSLPFRVIDCRSVDGRKKQKATTKNTITRPEWFTATSLMSKYTPLFARCSWGDKLVSIKLMEYFVCHVQEYINHYSTKKMGSVSTASTSPYLPRFRENIILMYCSSHQTRCRILWVTKMAYKDIVIFYSLTRRVGNSISFLIRSKLVFRKSLF